MFFDRCFLFFFFPTLLSIHLNDVQIFTNLLLDGRLMYKALIQMLQLSHSEDCWSKRNSYLSLQSGYLTLLADGVHEKSLTRMPWLPCLSPSALSMALFFQDSSFSFIVNHPHPTRCFSESRVRETAMKERKPLTKQSQQNRVIFRPHCTSISPN